MQPPDPDSTPSEQPLPEPLARFSSQVYAVAFSPDGRRVAVGLENGTIVLWDLLLREPWTIFTGHEGFVTSVAFSPDGTQLVSSSSDKTIRLWEVKTGQSIWQPFIQLGCFVTSVAFSPDGTQLVSSGNDRLIHLWEVKTGQPIGQPFTGHGDGFVRSVAFSPDGTQIASGSDDKTIRLWEVKTGRPIGQPFTGHGDYVNSVAFSPDGTQIASGSFDQTIRLWDAKAGQPIGQPFIGHGDRVNSVAFSPDGTQLASSSADRTIRLWEVKTGQPIGQPFTGRGALTRSVAFSPDGTQLVSGSSDQTIRLWEVKTGQPIGQPFIGHGDGFVNSVAFSPDGTQIASGSDDKTIRLWDAKAGQPIGQPFIGHGDRVSSVAFSPPNGTQLVSGSSDQTIRLWEVKTGQPIGQPFTEHGIDVSSVAFSPDGTQIASGSGDKTIRLWDAKARQPIGQPFIGHGSGVSSVAFSPDGTQIVSGSGDKTIRLWDAKAGQPIGQPFIGHGDTASSVAFLQLVPAMMRLAFITSVAFSPDGTQIASGSNDQTIRLWNAKTGQPIGQPFTGHQDSVRSVAFSPDGTQIVSGSSDQTVRLWDLTDPHSKRSLLIGKDEGTIVSVAFDPKGDYILSAGMNGIRAWRWQKFEVLRIPQAFQNDQPDDKDQLAIEKELAALADVLMMRSLEPPLAVAILGSWGSGKSFGMNLIKKHITSIRCRGLTPEQTWSDRADDPKLSPYVGHIYQIKFDAWTYAKSDIWASLMQTIFFELNRQLTLEKQLEKICTSDDGPDKENFLLKEQKQEFWRVLHDLSDAEREVILKNGLGEDAIKKWQDKETRNESLWEILGELKKVEQKKLDATEQDLKEQKQKKDQLEKQLQLRTEAIERKIDRNNENLALVKTFVTRLQQETAKPKDSLFRDISSDLKLKIPENLADLQRELSKDNADLEQLRQDHSEQIEPLIENASKIKSLLEDKPRTKLIGLIDFTQKHKKILLVFLCWLTLPFLVYALFSLLPAVFPGWDTSAWVAQIFSSLKVGLVALVSIPGLSEALKILKQATVWEAKINREFQTFQENVAAERQKLAADKPQKMSEQLEAQDYKDDKKKLDQTQGEITKLELQAEEQRKRAGLTVQYGSLLDFVTDRLQEDSYQKRLGLMHQIKQDLEDLSDRLTCDLKHSNPDRIAALKPHFPRGIPRVVLYIDDLDRCPPDRVVEVLEAVQLLLTTKLFIVILAVDDRYINRALENTYQGILKRRGTPSGVDYLEKIIQIPYRMRAISEKATLERYLRSQLDIEEVVEQKAKGQPISDETSEVAASLQPTAPPKVEKTPTPPDEQDDALNKRSQDAPAKSADPISPANANSTGGFIEIAKFTQEEFDTILDCCQYVDLTPRTTKRIINLCKILKLVWTSSGPNDTRWQQEPSLAVKQTVIAFLALSGRYPNQIRCVLEELNDRFEAEQLNSNHSVSTELPAPKGDLLTKAKERYPLKDGYMEREWTRFTNDVKQVLPRGKAEDKPKNNPKNDGQNSGSTQKDEEAWKNDRFILEQRTFNLLLSFCFIGDVGYDPDDIYPTLQTPIPSTNGSTAGNHSDGDRAPGEPSKFSGTLAE